MSWRQMVEQFMFCCFHAGFQKSQVCSVPVLSAALTLCSPPPLPWCTLVHHWPCPCHLLLALPVPYSFPGSPSSTPRETFSESHLSESKVPFPLFSFHQSPGMENTHIPVCPTCTLPSVLAQHLPTQRPHWGVVLLPQTPFALNSNSQLPPTSSSPCDFPHMLGPGPCYSSHICSKQGHL